ERFARLVPQAQWQEWLVDGNLSGPIAQPQVQAAITLTMPKAQGYGAEMTSATNELEPRTNGPFTFPGDGKSNAPPPPQPQVPGHLGDTLDFALTGEIDKSGKPALTAATIKLSPLAAEFTGRAAPEKVKGKLRLGRLDLAAFSPLAGRMLGGQVSADADIDMT